MPYTLETCSEDKIIIKIDRPGKETEICIKNNKVLKIFGNYITSVTVSLENGFLKNLDMDGQDCKFVEVVIDK